jgi:hypothetical protein
LAHAAALYTFRVKEKYGEHQLLGNFDGNGTYALEVMDAYLDGLVFDDPESERILRCLARRREGDELIASMQHGHSGLAATIVDRNQDERIHQEPTDTTLVVCGALFKVPRNQTTGWVALHVNGGNGIKGLLDLSVPARFGVDYPNHVLEIRPFIKGDALRQAIDENKLQKVRLVRYEKPNDRASASTNRWVPANLFGKIELAVSIRTRGEMLLTQAVHHFLDNQAGHDDIFEF